MKTFNQFLAEATEPNWNLSKIAKEFRIPEKDIDSVEYIMGALTVWYRDPRFNNDIVDQSIKMHKSEIQDYIK